MEEDADAAGLDAVRAYAADVVGLGPERPCTARRLDGGNRHDVYQFSYLDDRGTARHLVVRVSLTDDRD